MKESGRLLDKHEVVLYKAAFDKGTLVRRDHFLNEIMNETIFLSGEFHITVSQASHCI
jgi:hypothetical protein